MPSRPYINSSIVEIENIYKTSKDDKKVILDIYNELQYRKTHRAKELFNQIHKTINKSEEKEQNKIEPQKVLVYDRSKKSNIYPLTESVNVENCDESFNLREDTSKQKNAVKKRIFDTNQLTHPGVDSILSSWLTLEVLTPQPLPTSQDLEAINRQLIRLNEFPEPWNDKRYWKKGKETAIYWMIFLGELNLSKAVESILKAFPDEIAEERSEVRGNTTLSVIVLDAQGRPIPEKVFLSSFAWGYGKVRAGMLKKLSEFAEAERIIKSVIERKIIKQNEDGDILPVNSADLRKISEWLISELNLPQNEVELPGIAIRVPVFSLYSDAPEPELLNSFFIEDIVRVRKAFHDGNVGQALKAYMGDKKAPDRKDVVREKTVLSETLAPERMPLARWPGRGRYPLYLMQQAAINHSIKELAIEGLVSVNGPPGTGKTTLLRDIVANVVLDRAIAMARFANPEIAFKHVTSMKTGKAFSHLYELDNTLLGHEIVVASSNNKAVENISREIPSAAAIADDFNPPIKYFQSISDAIFAGDKELISGATWGLAAAVLGNSANKSAFINSFWWEKQRGLSSYLSAIISGYQPENEDESVDNSVQQEIPEVVRLENPPRNEIEALERWQTARFEFTTKLKRVQDLRKKAQEIYMAVNKRTEIKEKLDKTIYKITLAKQELDVAESKYNSFKRNYDKALSDESRAISDKRTIELLKPNFFTCLFRTRSYKDWNQKMLYSINEIKEARNIVQATFSLVEQAKSLLSILKSSIAKKEDEKSKLEQMYQSIIKIISEGHKIMGSALADEEFWTQDDKKLQLKSPWIFKDLQEARDDLFYSAFALHRAFIDASAKYMRHNLRIALEIMKGRALTEKQEPARKSLWASLFLVVPVISTTFASTSRLFGELGKEQLGWLLIDEAGQATPQAALGALWRSKRAIIIGDPLQIEPVVTIPPRLISSIFSQFGVSNYEWAAPDVSAQILADRSSWFGTTINLDDGELWVGSPLRVHRRCEQPMFSISNYIAYNNLMVYGTQDSISPIGEILGQSTWLNVDGGAFGKWSEDEGKIVIDLIKQLFESGLSDPDIFIITPFRLVASKLREMIRQNRWIVDHLPKKAWEWTNERIGTVHTFQGKEADTVILVLGAPREESSGARRWAGSMPNLLNVAVTRAKKRLYVVGSNKVWKNEGYFKYLSSSVPLKTVSN